jgi:hypothetical protein
MVVISEVVVEIIIPLVDLQWEAAAGVNIWEVVTVIEVEDHKPLVVVIIITTAVVAVEEEAMDNPLISVEEMILVIIVLLTLL